MTQIKVGDVVKARWFDDPTWYAGIVDKDEDGEFIYCPHRDTPEEGRTAENYVSVGYLKDAHEIIVMPEEATVAITRKDVSKAFLNELKRIPTIEEVDAVIEQLSVNFEPAYEWMQSLIRRKFT